MDLFTYLMSKKGHNIVIDDDMFAYLLGKANGGGGQIKTASGITINIPDAKKLVNFMLTKESTQDGTPTPNNPIPVETVKGYRNLLNKSNFANIYINSSGVETTDNKNAAFDFISASSNQAYTFSANTTLWRLNIAEYDENQTFIRITFGREVNTNTITTTANTRYIRPTINYDNSTTVTSSIINTLDLQIVEGTTTKPYVPYGNNYVDVKVIGKNLFDISNYFVRETRTNVEVNANSGYVKVTDDRTTVNKMIWFNIPVTSNQSYKISYLNNTFTRIQYIYTDIPFETWNELNAVPRVDIPNNNLLTPTTKYITFVFTMSNAVVEASISNLMLENGLVATTYEEYKETIVPIPLNNNEIVGIGDYKDELIVDKSGHCWLNKKTVKGIYDETVYTIKIDALSSSDYTQFNLTSLLPNCINSSYSKCNYLPYYSGATGAGKTQAGFVQGKINFVLSFPTSIANTVNDFKTWISTHNIVVYAPLETPDLIDLNTTVDLKLFKGVNNISNSEDANMTIEYR